MKPLSVISADLRDISAMQIELAQQLDELAAFFGGAAVLAPPAPPARASQPPQPLPQPVPRPAPPPVPQPAAAPQQVHPSPPARVSGEALSPETQVFERNGQVITRRRAQKEPSRQLSQEEKANIKRDWLSLPENLRNPTNRAAIAAKYRCSRAQVFALTRTDLHEHLMSANAAKLRKAEERQAARQG